MHAYHKVAIVGVGLIGGSIGKALRQRGLATEIVGVDRPSELRIAIEQGIVDVANDDLSTAVGGAEMVVVCTPVESIVASVIDVCRACQGECLITDVGSTKHRIVECIEEFQTGHDEVTVRFVGTHPLAGSQRSGARFADGDLFDGRVAVICPGKLCPAEDIDQVAAFWSALGSRVMYMAPRDHDRAIAATSHLPHIIAAALAKTTSQAELELVGTGWLDTTRIAAGDVELWTQILNDNREFLLAAMDRFDRCWSDMRGALMSGTAAELEHELQQGKSRRDVVGS